MSRPRRPVVDPPWWWLWGIIALMVGLTVLLLVWTRDAHAGPNTRVFEATAETGDMTEWDSTSQTGGATIVASAAATHSIRNGFLCTPVNLNKECRGIKNFPTSRHLHVRQYIKPSTLDMTGGGGIAHFLSVYPGQISFKVQLNVKDIGATHAIGVNVYEDASYITGGIIYVDTITAADWHEVYVYADQVAAPNGIIQVYVDGGLVWSADTLDLDNTRADSLRAGLSTGALQTNTGVFLTDDIVVDTMPCAPPCGIEPVKAEYGFPTGGF